MQINFQVIGIDKNEFMHLFELDEKELSKKGAIKQVVDSNPGYPCKVSLEDAEIGEQVILFPYRGFNNRRF